MMPYERFKAWEKCHELVLAIYTASKKWPREELYGLTAQARRAAFSAAANIVEGGARPGSREFSRFLGIAVASLYELAYILHLARDLGLLTAEDSRQLETAREHTSTHVAALRGSGKTRVSPQKGCVYQTKRPNA